MKNQRLDLGSAAPDSKSKKSYPFQSSKGEQAKGTKGRESVPTRSKMIKRQKLHTCNTVEDDEKDKLEQLNIYITHTPKYPKTEKQGQQSKKIVEEVKSFNIDQSFSNKHNTVKKEYELRTDNELNDVLLLDKHQISIKNQTNPQENKQKQKTQEEKASGNGFLYLNEGWTYRGEYVSGLFHGFGELYHQQSLIYSGTFEFGYLHGYGKLKHHPAFDYLVNLKSLERKSPKGQFSIDDSSDQVEWTAFFGEFQKGNITGYGQLWLASGQKVGSKWVKGTKVGKHWKSNFE